MRHWIGKNGDLGLSLSISVRINKYMNTLLLLKTHVENEKYYNWYCNIVTKNKGRKYSKGCSLEKHHIFPHSMGGSDDNDNLVVLTTREHFICHLLLVKMLESGQHRHKMLFALNMIRFHDFHERYFNSRLYETYRKEFQEAQSKRMTEYMSIPENRENLRNRVVSEETRKKLAEKAREQDRSSQPLGNRALVGNNRTEKQLTAAIEHGHKMRGRSSPRRGISSGKDPWNKGKKMPGLKCGSDIEYTCPHCGKVGRGSGMMRWHFDNCSTVKQRQKEEIVTCPHCNTSGSKGAMKAWHFENCPLSPTPKQRPKYIKVTCPHCGVIGGKNIMPKFHFDKCKLNDKNNPT